MKYLVLISSRQLLHVAAMASKLENVALVAIVSEEEHNQLKLNDTFSNFIFHIVDIVSSDGVLWEYNEEQCAKVIANLKAHSITLTSLDEGNLLLCARLRQLFNIPGPTVEDIAPYRDKLMMKQTVRNANAHAPVCEKVTNRLFKKGYQNTSQEIGLKMVVKPTSSAGSNNVFVINNESSFNQIIKRCCEAEEEYEIEEFVEGSHYHCDTIFDGEDCIFAACTEYIAPTLEFQSGSPLGGRALDPNSSIAKKLVATTIPIVRALGTHTIAQHTELIVKKDGTVVFLESGARPPGMYVVQTYENAFGINIVELVIAETLKEIGLVQSILLRAKSSVFQEAFYLVYPKQQGYVHALNPLPNELTSRVFLSHACETGELHNGCRSNLDFCASVLSKSETVEIEAAYQKMKHFNPVDYVSETVT